MDTERAGRCSPLLGDVRWAILETNGQISFVGKGR
jgi:uncharacterized membrane protein YcaP (DUF421 family)